MINKHSLFGRKKAIFLLVLVISSFLTSLIPVRAQAATLTIEDEYKIWRSYTIVAGCMNDYGFRTSDVHDSPDDTIHTIFDERKGYQGGKIYQKIAGTQSDHIDCVDDMDVVLSNLGFTGGIFDFTEFMGTKNLSQADARQKLQGYVQSKGARLALDQQKDFQFWFWNKVYRNSTSAGGCDGVLSNERKSNYQVNTDTGGPFYAVNESGTPSKYTFANFNTTGNVEAIDEVMTASSGIDTPSCRDIVKLLSKDRATPYAAAIVANPANFQSSGDQAADGGTTQPTCESQNSTIILGWILCQGLAAIDGTITQLMKAVDDLLYVNPTTFATPQIKAIWSYFRILATGVLVIIGLVMVIGQAINIGPFDAYTVKRLLPRILIGIIGIQLSWFLFTGLIFIVNAIAWGVEGLMYAPFGGAGNFDVKSILGKTTGSFFLLAGGAVVAGGFALGLLGMLSIAVTALIAVVFAFALLSVRQFVLIALLVAAPIGIVLWILPNTEKLWKIYWESFSKLLLMYPMIIFLIAAGRVFAYTVSGVASNSTDGWLASAFQAPTRLILIVIGLFGPFFLIPKTFQLAGSAFANIAGIANDRSRGVFDRLKNYRGNKVATNMQNTAAGHRFKGTNALTNRFNSVNRGALAGFKTGAKREAFLDSQAFGTSEDIMKDKGFTGIMYDDGAMRAMTYKSKKEAKDALYARDRDAALAKGMSAAEAAASAEASSNAAVDKASLVGFGGNYGVAAAQRLAMNKTGYSDSLDAMQTIERVSGGNGSLETSLKENIKFTNKGVGRNDMGALRSMNDDERAMAAAGDQEGARKLWGARMTLEGAKTADAASLARNHNNSLKNIEDAFQTINGGAAGSTSADLDAARSVAIDLNKSKDYATRGNLEQIGSMGDTPTGGTHTPTLPGQTVRPSDSDPTQLVVEHNRGASRPETLGDVAEQERRGGASNPNDERLPHDD